MQARARAGQNPRGRRLCALLVLVLGSILVVGTPGAGARVLRVGTYHGSPGEFSSIQAAVNQAQPGDWILIGPGDYHETGNTVPPGARGDDRAGGSVLITTAGLHVRGMDRNGVILDGTKPGSPECGPAGANQDFGPNDANGKPTGRNGIVVFKSAGTSVENLTACNFLTGDQGGGDLIWFDGGGSTGTQYAGAWRGAYLSATSTYYKDSSSPFANYGLYASNTKGPGTFTQTYANNQADAAYYVGACPDCNTILDNAHGANSDLGYSGTNSGGHLIVQNSEFDHNQSGFVTNSQNNDDYPSPQDGACPHGGLGPRPVNTQSKNSCWVFTRNSVHDNNNPNVPTSGSAAAGPVGSGVVIAGGRNNIVTGNRFFNNKAWGVLLVPYPDLELPPSEASPACVGGVPPNQPNPPAGQGNGAGQDPCYFDDFGNEVANNTFSNNGTYGNVSNGDLAEISNAQPTGNCWHGNVEQGGGTPTSDPPNIQGTHGTCGQPNSGNSLASPLGAQVACDSQFLGPCPLPPQAVRYDRKTSVALAPLPRQPSMADPCQAVPRNAWCPKNPVSPGAYPVPGPPYSSASRRRRHHRRARHARCSSRRVLVLHLRRSVSGHLRGATVTVNGHRVHVSRRLTVRISLLRRGKAAVVVRIRGRLRGGGAVRQTRRYHPCVQGARGRAHRRRHGARR